MRTLTLLSISALCLSACATTQTTTPNFGQATAHNRSVQAIPAKPEDKANRFIPADKSRQTLAIQKYRSDQVEEPVPVSTSN